MWIELFSYTFVGLTNYYLKIKSDYSKQTVLYALVTLYFLYILYLFVILRYSPGIFQCNQNMPTSVNQRPQFYSAILIIMHL